MIRYLVFLILFVLGVVLDTEEKKDISLKSFLFAFIVLICDVLLEESINLSFPDIKLLEISILIKFMSNFLKKGIKKIPLIKSFKERIEEGIFINNVLQHIIDVYSNTMLKLYNYYKKMKDKTFTIILLCLIVFLSSLMLVIFICLGTVVSIIIIGIMKWSNS